MSFYLPIRFARAIGGRGGVVSRRLNLRGEGLEPTRLSAYGPKPYASANSAILAKSRRAVGRGGPEIAKGMRLKKNGPGETRTLSLALKRRLLHR